MDNEFEGYFSTCGNINCNGHGDFYFSGSSNNHISGTYRGYGKGICCNGDGIGIGYGDEKGSGNG